MKGKQYEIKYDDEVYSKYASTFIQDAKNGIIQDYQEMQNNNEAVKYQKNKNNIKVDKMRDILGDISDFNVMIK